MLLLKEEIVLKGSVWCSGFIGVGAEIGDGFLARNGFWSFAKNGERRQTVPKRDSPQKNTRIPPTMKSEQSDGAVKKTFTRRERTP